MTLTLKHDQGWFAAGVEVENALKVLTDGAFKLFIHLCLAAPRQTGVLETSQSELARTLHKSNATIRKYLQEMEEQGVCRLSGFVPVPYCRGRIEITDDFWPYHRNSAPSNAHTVGDESLDQVRRLLEERSCVAASFSTADEILARKWLEDGVSIERIEQAILLGCARKYVAWRNHHDVTPIRSLHYFEPVLEEIDQMEISSDYWKYVRSRMRRMEQLWDQDQNRQQTLEAEN
ncbi:MAG: hypothetical protein P8Y94_04570 [Acidobacteriota bacterium]